MERFYVDPDRIRGKEARIRGEEFRHLQQVLRLKVGDTLEIFDGKGKGFSGRLAELDKQQAVVRLEAPVTEQRDSVLRVCLAQAIPKGDRMEWVVQKATELGVAAIQPLELSRCIVRLDSDEKRRDRQARWQKVAAEAARQCGRLWIPKVLFPLKLEAFLTRIRPGDLLLIPWEEGGQGLQAYIRETAQSIPGGEWRDRQLFLMIGPEGGMTEEEVEAGRLAGGKVLTLGPRILRTDTAGLMLLSVLQYQWGDMGGPVG
ncbi:MAG: 16S rRNA (uracil(1498)-N(3))-methyltransferase [Clostridiales bacterium]|nr:16S rRNA (uracil(1498)-N(3))-methyltransferase [Clostridiales bacterium]